MQIDKPHKPKRYCKNSRMLNELQKFHDTDVISNDLGQMFIDISTRLCGHSWFRNYNQYLKDDLVSAALEKMVKGVTTYDMKYTNPFAYFTQIAFNAFIQSCKKHYKHINIRRKIASNYYISAESSGMIDSNTSSMMHLREIMDSNGYTKDDDVSSEEEVDAESSKK